MRYAPRALLCRIKILKTSFFLPLKSSLAAKIPLGFFTFSPFYFFTFKDCSW